MTLPATLAINAWTGEESAHGAVAAGGETWGARRGLPGSQAALAFAGPADPTHWADPDVGYGILLPDNDDPALTPAMKAAAEDAEEPVRDILRARPGTVVLRWRPELKDRYVRRYFADGTSQDPVIGLTPFGLAKGHLPRYVVIVGGPEVIPWAVQYALEVRHAVGRLPLSGDALDHYVSALLSDWSSAVIDVEAPLLWSVDHGGGDITSLMRSVITAPLAQALDGTLPGLQDVTGASSTGDRLLSVLHDVAPALVVTSSHGRTGPLDDGAAMRATLGLPVDAGYADVGLDALVEAMPAGAVWYAQACCSAGADGTSHYAGLLAEGTSVVRSLESVAALGAMVAPAPLQLLGRENPVRAVLGHVEPTFDWTLRIAETGQQLGDDVVTALSSNLFFGQPLGYAFDAYRSAVGQLHTQWAEQQQALAGGDPSVREDLTRLRLTALDRQSLVLLGDPTVTIPARADG